MSQEPHYVSFPRSDGDRNKWPTSTTEKVNSAGEVNWMRHLDLDDEPNIRWRTAIGDALMKWFKWSDDGRPYILTDFPSNYRLYDHHKGHVSKPRHDHYLFGANSRFRTIYEFVPHAIWLFTENPSPTQGCRCRYCIPRGQKVVTEELAAAGIIPKKPNNPFAASQSASVSRPPAPKPARTPAAPQASASAPVAPETKRTRKQAKPIGTLTSRSSPKPRTRKNKDPPKPSPPATGRPKRGIVQKKTQYETTLPEPSPHVVAVREDIQLIAVSRDRDLRAVSISHDMHSMRMKRWLRPEEIVWVHLATPLVGPIVDGEQAVLDYWPAMVTDFKLKSSALPSSDASAPWTIQQHYEYTVDLIRLPSPPEGFVYSDEAVIPFQAYRPSHAVFKLLHGVAPASQDFPAHVRDCILSGRSDRSTFDIALSVFHIAFWTTMIMGQFWSLTDKHTIKYPKNLSAADLAAAQRTASSLIPSLPTPTPSSFLGSPDTKSVTQFGGMWLGTERIWVGDFVRMKLARRYIATSRAEYRNLSSQPFVMRGAQFAHDILDCPVAMRIQRLFLVDAKTADGKDTKECRVGGLLYELAPVDTIMASTSAFRHSRYPKTVSPMDLHSKSAPPSPTEDDALYPLPDAPPGYVFRPLLDPGMESVTTLSFIAGRYYPRIISHPLLADKIVPTDIQRCAHLLGLEGIVPFEDVVPIRHLPDRDEIVKEAEKLANSQIREHARQMLPNILDPNAMQVDNS